MISTAPSNHWPLAEEAEVAAGTRKSPRLLCLLRCGWQVPGQISFSLGCVSKPLTQGRLHKGGPWSSARLAIKCLNWRAVSHCDPCDITEFLHSLIKIKVKYDGKKTRSFYKLQLQTLHARVCNGVMVRHVHFSCAVLAESHSMHPSYSTLASWIVHTTVKPVHNFHCLRVHECKCECWAALVPLFLLRTSMRLPAALYFNSKFMNARTWEDTSRHLTDMKVWS